MLFCSHLSAADFWPASCVQTISIGQTVNGVISTATDCAWWGSDASKKWYTDVYSFTGTAGQKVAISMVGSAGFDPDLTLYLGNSGASANQIAYDDDGGGDVNARIPATSGYITLASTGTYTIWASTAYSNTGGNYTLTLSTDSPAPAAEVIEFFHAGLDHYFMTADPNEAAGLVGNSALGWVRTGNTFKSGGSTPVCRFYGSMTPGPNSHFYTLAGAECDSLKQLQASTPATEKRWNFESLDFSSTPAIDGTCENGAIPVYRAYNDGYAKGADSNHRTVRKVSAIQEVVNRGWVNEGVVMCAPASTNQGITGGTFTDPSGIARVTVTTGTIPSYVNASGPNLKPVTQLDKGVEFDAAGGEINVTRGGLGYEFDLTGDSGFVTTAAGAVKISLPIDTANIPAADLTSPVKVFMRIYNPDSSSNVDVTGEITSSGGVTRLTVEARGLPNRFVAIIVYNPNMDATLVDDATPSSNQALSEGQEKAATSWPAKAWCVTYNIKNATLIDQVKSIRGISTAPTREEIRNTVSYKLGARKAQLTYERDGFLAPNLYTGKPCGGNTAHYIIHLSEKLSSAYRSGTPDVEEEIGADEAPYGRIHIQYGHISILGHVIAHEMHHAIQYSYELHGNTVRGYKEGTATIYGNTIYNNGTISTRKEIEKLNSRLMTPDLQPVTPPPPGSFKVGTNGYANQDFFAYVGKQYNNNSLAYISGLYTRMRSDIGAGISNVSLSLLNGSLDAYLNSAFSLGLKDIYLDFVKQRALAHNPASQFGRTGEVTSGFADNLFSSGFKEHTIPLPVCNGKVTGKILNLSSLSSNFLRIRPTGTLTTGDGPKVTVKLTPSFGAIGGAWSGFSYRDKAMEPVKTSNIYTNFGKKAGDEAVLLFSNLDLAQSGFINYELSCESLQITAIAPAKGPVDTAVTISGVGFGTASDTRAVYFNGIKASSVTWSSDTQAVAKVPQNASTGDVVVEVNGSKSNGLPFEIVAQCSATQNQGADTPDTRSVELGKTSGTFNFLYQTFDVKDQMLVRYDGATLFDTGCVGTGTTKTKSISYSGKSSQISVQVIPNCAGTTSTGWQYTVTCPN
jgi:hypothetical protein